MIEIIIAVVVGLIFTLWLVARQFDYQPMFGGQRSSSPLWWVVIGMALLGVGALVYVASNTNNGSMVDSSGAVVIVSATPPRSEAQMLIPSLNVNEKIVTVPIKDGEWDISRLSRNIGWLVMTGDNPNSEYAMTFIGHVTVSSIEKGPFADLYKIKPLSEIIYRNGGVDFVYVVETLMPVPPTEVSKLFQRKKEHLLLVTCTDYDLLTSTYKGRLLVDAVLVRRKIDRTQTSN